MANFSLLGIFFVLNQESLSRQDRARQVKDCICTYFCEESHRTANASLQSEEAGLKLSHFGTMILSDNLIPKRAAIEGPDPTDVEAIAVYHFNQMLADHPALETVPLMSIVAEEGRMDSLGVMLLH